MCDIAAEVLGFQRKNYKGQMIENNPIIEQLSTIQKEYRIKIENSSNIEVKKLCNIRNQTLKHIKNEIKKNNVKEIEDVAKIIQNDNQSTAMFKACLYYFLSNFYFFSKQWTSKNYKKCFLFYIKSSFHSRVIKFFVIFSLLFHTFQT